MEAAPQVAVNAKTATNILPPPPPHSSRADPNHEDPEIERQEETRSPTAPETTIAAASVNDVMAKSVSTAGTESPPAAVDGEGASKKVITDAAKAAAVAAAEALKSGNVTIAHPHLNTSAAKLISSISRTNNTKNNHPNLCLKDTRDAKYSYDVSTKDGKPPNPSVPKGTAASQQQMTNCSSPPSPPFSNTIKNSSYPSETNMTTDETPTLVPHLPNSNSTIIVPPLAPSSNDEGLDDSHSGDEDHPDLIKLKPPRPPRKKVKETLKEPLYEEDIIEGFSFAAFKTYEDLEVSENNTFLLLPNYWQFSNVSITNLS